MFKEIREQVKLTDAIQRYTGLELIPAGTNTWELEDKSCPLCGHSDCFKVRDSDERTNFKCFSCDEWGADAVSFYASLKGVDLVAAARHVAKDFGVQFDNDMSSHQKIFELAAEYMANCLLGSRDEILTKDGKQYTPLSYQTERRGHSEALLRRCRVGWNDGNLIRFLHTFDFTEEELLESGLLSKDKKSSKTRAFLKKGCFVYPHYVKGLVSHFTQKDPLGETPPYQIRNENRLNGHLFMGQDTVAKASKVVIVEGENDWLSLMEVMGDGIGVICTNGQVSAAQKKWVEMYCGDKEVITIFDRDDAGDKYRNMFWKLGLKNLKQYVAPEGLKDVDEMLHHPEFGHMSDLVEVPDPEKMPVDGAEVVEGHDIFELDGGYCKLKISASSGERHIIRLSNFLIKLRNVFIKGDGERSREIVVIRQDGARSSPLLINSGTKVSLRSFKESMADAIDASFYGDENDLLAMWDFIYAKGADKIVAIPAEIGKLRNGGWLFGDVFITSTGAVVQPDSEGVMWIGGNTTGIKPASINVKHKTNAIAMDIPRVMLPMEKDARVEFRNEFMRNFITNIGNIGAAVTMLGWMKANAYSNPIYDKYGFFPFLFLWGRHGKGKTSITRWLMDLYGMSEVGSSTIPQLVSGVGFTRMLGYFSSLPLLLDEVRADKEAREFYGHFRAWYNRQGRSMGSAKDSSSIVTQEVRANIIFCGQDVFTDPATRSRCVEVQIPAQGRELEVTYAWIEAHSESLPSVGYQWILESTTADMGVMFQTLQAYEKEIISSAKCDSRLAKHWAIIRYFGETILEELDIQYDMHSHVVSACSAGFEDQRGDDMVMRFFHTIEGMQCMEHSVISGTHIRVEGNILYMWVSELIRLARERGGPSDGERFSANAIRSAIRDEESYIDLGKDDRRRMGPGGERHRVNAFDLSKAPDVLQTIAQYANRAY